MLGCGACCSCLITMYYELKPCVKAQYLERISLIRKDDPYVLKLLVFFFFCKDPLKVIACDLLVYIYLTPTKCYVFGYPGIVICVLYTTSFMSLMEVKNYKSLQSFKDLINRWVLKAEWKKY